MLFRFHISGSKRFSLSNAVDRDVGTNALKTYQLSESEYFSIEVQSGREGSKFADLILKKTLDREKQAVHNLILTAIDGGTPARSGTAIKESEEDKIPFLVLKKPLDREGKSEHHLVLTALDGGTPSRSGNLNLTITVLDVNDNRPVFSKDIYTVSLNENAPLGTLVIKVNATDSDEGLNGEIEYTFGKTQKKKVYDIFELDSITGEIRVKGKVDFEETEIYRLDLQASDKGQPRLTGESRVVIKLKDLNDNKPEIEITSLSSQIPEDSKPGTVVSLISVTDRDSGMNGKVICKISDNVPFDLTPSIEENISTPIFCPGGIKIWDPSWKCSQRSWFRSRKTGGQKPARRISSKAGSI
uniref:Si:ch73-379j16.2 n=1 Tax=Poecilia latipinna TaxID=48699 RepID=A0A3B3UYE8_9TELE